MKILDNLIKKFKRSPHYILIKTFWPFLWSTEKSIRIRFLGAFFILLISMGLGIMAPLLLKKIIEIFQPPITTKETIIFLIVSLYGLIWTLTKISLNLREVFMFQVMEKAVMRLSAHIFEHLHSLSYDFHIKRKTGEITSAIEKAQNAFPGILWPLFFLIIPTFLEVFVVLVILSYLYGSLFGLIMIGTILFFLLYSFKALKWSLNALRQSNEKHYQCNSSIVDSFINFSTIKLFNSHTLEFTKCRTILQEREASMVQALIRGRFVSLGQDFIVGSTLLLFSLISAHRVLYEGYSVGDFVLINSYILQFSIPLSSLGFVLSSFREQLTHMEKVLEILNQKPHIKDGKELLQIPDQTITISCKDIHFGYKVQRPILKGISFDLFPGKTLAIIGPTGSGKSTISNLLMHFYEYSEGEILINGQSIRTLKQESFLKYFGVVPQDITLFNDSLKNNLTYGNPSVSEEELNAVIKLTLLDTLTHSLPEGLSTIVGERGLTLSTGEKQKVGIARVLLKNPSVYIFDEATSSLDIETEERIMKNIRNNTKNATVLIIAHRLSTVRLADQILVFNKGKIVEKGTHTALLNQKGLYANLWYTQNYENLKSE